MRAHASPLGRRLKFKGQMFNSMELSGDLFLERKRQNWDSCDIYDSPSGREREWRYSRNRATHPKSGDTDTVENSSYVHVEKDCRSVVVYSGSSADRAREERLLELSWEADSMW